MSVKKTKLAKEDFEKTIQLIKMSTSGLVETSEAQIHKAFKKIEKLEWISAADLDFLKSSTARRLRRSKGFFDKQVNVAVKDTVKRIEALSKREISRLEKTILKMEKKIDKIAASA